MKLTENERFKKKYNIKNNIIPKTLKSKRKSKFQIKNSKEILHPNKILKEDLNNASEKEIKRLIIENKKLMEKSAKALNFIEAATHRDNIKFLKEILLKKNKY